MPVALIAAASERIIVFMCGCLRRQKRYGSVKGALAAALAAPCSSTPVYELDKLKSLLTIIGPGVLVAATGVGAGDLATAAFTGTRLGTAVLWAVLIGAGLKYVLNEGLTRWQLATRTTLLEGCVTHLGRWCQWLFLGYLVVWSYLVAMALMSACGVVAHAMVPIFESPTGGKVVYGIAHSLIAVILVRLGGYSLFEKVMSVCIGVMFVVVLATAVAIHPPWGEVVRGLVVPTIPEFRGEGLAWTVALLGGVGGTVTVLCYGYWIREEGRTEPSQLGICRIDLAVGYGMTAVFGLAMVIIGSRLGDIEGKGASLVINIAQTLETTFGRFGVLARWAFLLGAWGAFFSSLLGVWQSVPYLFTDFVGLMRSPNQQGDQVVVNTRSISYRACLVGIAVIPITGLLLFDFRSAVKVYAVVGAFFIPMLAAALLLLNGNGKLVGEQHRNSPAVTTLLVITLLVFLAAGTLQIQGALVSLVAG